MSEAGRAQGIQFQHGSLQTFLAGLPAGLTADRVTAGLLQFTGSVTNRGTLAAKGGNISVNGLTLLGKQVR